MNIITEAIEKDMSSLLQQEIIFTHKNKTLKEGKLILFSVKDFYLNFRLQLADNSKLVLFEMPYPFFYTNSTNGVTLSYKVDKFINTDAELQHMMKFYFFGKPSKFYDTEVSILRKTLAHK